MANFFAFALFGLKIVCAINFAIDGDYIAASALPVLGAISAFLIIKGN